MASPTADSPAFSLRFGMGRLMLAVTLVAVSIAAARVPYAVVTSTTNHSVPHEQFSELLAWLSVTALAAAVGVLMQRVRVAVLVGFILGELVMVFAHGNL